MLFDMDSMPQSKTSFLLHVMNSLLSTGKSESLQWAIVETDATCRLAAPQCNC